MDGKEGPIHRLTRRWGSFSSLRFDPIMLSYFGIMPSFHYNVQGAPSSEIIHRCPSEIPNRGHRSGKAEAELVEVEPPTATATDRHFDTSTLRRTTQSLPA